MISTCVIITLNAALFAYLAFGAARTRKLRVFASSREPAPAAPSVPRDPASGAAFPVVSTPIEFRCRVCRELSRSTVIDAIDEGEAPIAEPPEFVACQHCQCLTICEAGVRRPPTIQELRWFACRWPITFRAIRTAQKTWLAKQRGLSIGGDE